MGDETAIIVSVYDAYGKQILKTALKSKNNILTEDVVKYYREPENEKIILNLLPKHCRGQIVDVEEIFWVK